MSNERLNEVLRKHIENVNNAEPPPDLASCSTCGWKGKVEECGNDTEGDFESGYYGIHLCTKCNDGGCVDDYNMSPEQMQKWTEWHTRMHPPE